MEETYGVIEEISKNPNLKKKISLFSVRHKQNKKWNPATNLRLSDFTPRSPVSKLA